MFTVNAVKKIIQRISPHFLQKITKKFTAFLSKIHGIDFCGKLIKKCGECSENGEGNNSPHFTAIPTKTHFKIDRIS